MAINFDSLPNEKPNSFELFSKDVYPAKITKATIETSGTTGSKYLKIIYLCTDPKTGKTTTIFDNLFDTDKPLLRYKLGQFIRALQLNLNGSFELVDLAKIIINKELMVAIKVEQNEGYTPRNVVDAFDDGIFYPMTSVSNTNAPVDDSDLPFSTGGTSY